GLGDRQPREVAQRDHLRRRGVDRLEALQRLVDRLDVREGRRRLDLAAVERLAVEVAPRRSASFRRAWSTRMRRMASAAAAKKWPRLPQPGGGDPRRPPSTRRRYASWTSAVASSVWPGFSWAIRCAASRRSSA